MINDIIGTKVVVRLNPFISTFKLEGIKTTI